MMSNTDTPRTDEWIKRQGPHGRLDGFQFARTLERELNTAKETLERCESIARNCTCPAKDMDIAVLKGKLKSLQEELFKEQAGHPGEHALHDEPLDRQVMLLNRQVAALSNELSRYKAVAEDLARSLDVSGRECHHVHHGKRDQHKYNQDCPVVPRIKRALTKLNQLKRGETMHGEDRVLNCPENVPSECWATTSEQKGNTQ